MHTVAKNSVVLSVLMKNVVKKTWRCLFQNQASSNIEECGGRLKWEFVKTQVSTCLLKDIVMIVHPHFFFFFFGKALFKSTFLIASFDKI